MSFHEPASDVGRLNREAAAGAAVAVDRRTAEVLRLAGRIGVASGGAFDISVAPQVVGWGYLPAPAGAPAADPAARGTDVEIDAADRVRFRRPLWIDLGGIAKGYAVDAALRAMAPLPSASVRISAGGDLRVTGPGGERVLLQVPGHATGRVPVVELADGALASSTSLGLRRPDGAGGWIGVHVDGRSRAAAPSARFATVVAPDCALADALTKVVLALGEAAEPVLEAFGAGAYVHEPGAGWRTLGVAA
jgi:thiamine biosynthesis lipoprotein